MESRLLTKQTLSLSLAKELALAAEAVACSNEWTVVITLVDDSGNLVYLLRMDGTQLASIEIAIAKATSVIYYKRPTKLFEETLVGGRQAILNLPGAMPVEGGLPLIVDNAIIGAIGISGVRADQDGLIAAAGVEALEKHLTHKNPEAV
jgi:glc operon protein GlcG